MEDLLWHLLASSRGGPTRVAILRTLEKRPRNANELAEAIDKDYTTVRHHTDILVENNVLRKSAEEYGALYLFTEQVRTHWDTVEEILDVVE